MMMNLVKYISACGAASRRMAETFVRGGRVTVNGAVETNPARRIGGGEQVALDGRVLRPVTAFRYILLNKPRGYTCSNADRHAEKLAVDLIDIPDVRLVSAGRLDKDSEGAIIFSNDGNFINALAHPSFGVLKRYIVETSADIDERGLEKIRAGITDDGEFLRVEKVEKIGRKRFEFLLNEGKKREIRRLTAAVGAVTVRLKRVEIGPIRLDVESGRWRDLDDSEIAALTPPETPK